MNKIGVIGLGYVGLPLSLEFAKNSEVIGFDIDPKKVRYLAAQLTENENLRLTSDYQQLSECNVFIIAVPTPVDSHKTPDLSLLKQACEMLSELVNPDDLVVIESTVYPGATRQIAAHVLSKGSGLALHTDSIGGNTPCFYLGYSPERISPGDNERSLVTISKVVSGSSSEALRLVKILYQEIIKADVVEASSIEVAEAAKVIENVQRDVNIALMNEFSMSFDALGLNAQEIFKVASTKWNFLDFMPGLVGGHCIGVDPYYFLYEISRVGLESPIIRSARLVNESMVNFVVRKILGLQRKLSETDNSIGVLGVSFKKDCDDVRNSKNVELCEALHLIGFEVFWCDPLVSSDLAIEGCHRVHELKQIQEIDGLVYAVDHREFNRDHIKSIECKFFVDLQNSFPVEATWSL